MIQKPWGYEDIFAHTDKYAGKILFVKKGHQLSLQYHRLKDETIYVAEGQIALEMAGINSQMSKGESIRIKPGTRHRIRGIEDSFLFEVSTPELDDVVRITDDYGRSGGQDGATTGKEAQVTG